MNGDSYRLNQNTRAAPKNRTTQPMVDPVGPQAPPTLRRFDEARQTRMKTELERISCHPCRAMYMRLTSLNLFNAKFSKPPLMGSKHRRA